VASVKNQWTKTVRQPDGGVERVRNQRWGRGKRWLAVWLDPAGNEKSRAFSSKVRAEKYASEMETGAARGEYADPRAGQIRFDEVLESWLKSRSVDPTSMITYETALRRHVRSCRTPRLSSPPTASRAAPPTDDRPVSGVAARHSGFGHHPGSPVADRPAERLRVPDHSWKTKGICATRSRQCFRRWRRTPARAGHADAYHFPESKVDLTAAMAWHSTPKAPAECSWSAEPSPTRDGGA
jgi:hypothetical protein